MLQWLSTAVHFELHLENLVDTSCIENTKAITTHEYAFTLTTLFVLPMLRSVS